MELRLKRIYDPPEDSDGLRILVDRLWPRGLRKGEAGIDFWAKDVAPSTELRRWFHSGEDDAKWAEFRRRYEAELARNRKEVEALRARIKGRTATLLYAAADREHNHAIVLRDFLERGPHES
jgi:uncharacterized protein YeaO (DUF488 family)